ncbi:hypothetical protein C8R41DRAFT_915973 [Lentinula lateritia]|uniref:Uncharacterized protein n=1 Tax=Lentinula lateritia TaxID=40482 RepID=A0ABQ8VSE0_9AGAR|nr:hypothetical protein C8R41DRAFT_915973 [Lentinula lateritia]
MSFSVTINRIGSGRRRQSRTSTASAQCSPMFMQIAEHNDTGLLRDLFIEFKQHAKKRKLVTFDKRTMKWMPWNPPIEQSQSGQTTTVCPMEYTNILGYEGPLCPHISNGFFTDDDCTMVVRTYHSHGETQYYFLAPHVGCEFRMKILWSANLSLDFGRGVHWDETVADISFTYLSNRQWSNLSSSSTREIEHLLQHNSSSSIQTIISPSSTDHCISNTIDSSVNSSYASLTMGLSVGTVTQSQVLPSTTTENAPETFESFYEEDSARARASPDLHMVQVLRDAFHDGVFRKYPSLHPTYNDDNPPSILQSFDPRSTPGTSTFSHLQYFDTVVGKVETAMVVDANFHPMVTQVTCSKPIRNTGA